jgi:tryptophan-rich sensory protein
MSGICSGSRGHDKDRRHGLSRAKVELATGQPAKPMIESLQAMWMPIAIASGVAILVAVAGGVATDTGSWYKNLVKPWWQPPNWLFGPVWTTIFVLAVASSVIAWQRAGGAGDRQLIIALFVINAVLNIAWSVLFFKLRRPDWALGEVALLWLSIVALIVGLWPIAPISSLLLAPYLLWVSIATFLNFTIIQLNAPFRKLA